MSFERISRRVYRRWRFPLDQVALTLMASLAIAAILLVASGDHATARVQSFSWQSHTVGADNIAFAMTFTRPMDPKSVEANLQITPDLPGRVSWAGRRMAYTLDVPVPYGETYEVSLPDARDRFSDEEDGVRFEAFTGEFQSRDRAISYIGTSGDEAGRLVMINFSQDGEAVVLTPKDLKVLDFEPYPLGDRILFSAVKQSDFDAGELVPALYTVATGLNPNPPADLANQDLATSIQPDEVGTLTPVLEGGEYQNLAFDLAPNGKIIVVQRVNSSQPTDFGPWIVAEGESPRKLDTEPGGEFLIGPDSQTLLMLQGQGTAVIPLEATESASKTSEPLDFLPEFGRVFDVSSDGSAAAMVDFNQNDPEKRFTETLVIVTNQGEETKMLDATGSVMAAQFDPTNRILYTLASDLLPGEAYQEQPYLAAAVLDEEEDPLKLLTFPPQSRVSMDISPDGLAALIEVSLADPNDPMIELTQTVLLPLFETTDQRVSGTPTQTEPQVLSFAGIAPTWLP